MRVPVNACGVESRRRRRSHLDQDAALAGTAVPAYRLAHAEGLARIRGRFTRNQRQGCSGSTTKAVAASVSPHQNWLKWGAPAPPEAPAFLALLRDEAHAGEPEMSGACRAPLVLQCRGRCWSPRGHGIGTPAPSVKKREIWETARTRQAARHHAPIWSERQPQYDCAVRRRFPFQPALDRGAG